MARSGPLNPKPPRVSGFGGAALLTAGLLFCSSLAWAGETSLRGYLESDLRMTIAGKKDRPPNLEVYRFLRNENTASITSSMSSGDVLAVFNASMIYTGFPAADKMAALTDRQAVDPVRIESDALYLEIFDFLPYVDFRLGRQVMKWGSADIFNPTSVLNPYDLEDPLKFGEAIATEMASMRWSAPWYIEGEEDTIFEEFSLTVAVVPIFRPGMLPDSALYVFTDSTVFQRYADSQTLLDLIGLQKAYEEGGGDILFDVGVDSPDASLKNMQYGARVGWTLFGVDMGLMAYQGFDDIARAERVDANAPRRDPMALSDDAGKPITGVPDPLKNIDATMEMVATIPSYEGYDVLTEIQLAFPRVQVLGADFSASIEPLGGLGVWAEAALTLHDALYRSIRYANYPYSIERELEKDSFLKITAGLDYSITSWWYTNLQYVHGFVDEFGRDKLKDYVVGGADLKAFQEKVLIRLFAILQLQDQSFLVYPQVTLDYWQDTKLSMGGLIFAGAADSKFGGRETGSNTLYLRARYSF
jgi:hypothetical protein